MPGAKKTTAGKKKPASAGAVVIKKQAGRPAKSTYTAAQLQLIETANKQGAGYRKIVKRYPDEGLT